MQIVNFYFLQHSTTSLNRKVAYLVIPYSTIRNMLGKLVNMFPYKISEVHQETTRLCSTSSHYSNVYRRHVVRIQLPTLDSFLERRHFSRLTMRQHSKHSYFGPETPRPIRKEWTTQRIVTLRCAVHASYMRGPYYLNIETVRIVDYYQVLEIYILWEAQQYYIKLFSGRIELLVTLHVHPFFYGWITSVFMDRKI